MNIGPNNTSPNPNSWPDFYFRSKT